LPSRYACIDEAARDASANNPNASTFTSWLDVSLWKYCLPLMIRRFTAANPMHFSVRLRRMHAERGPSCTVIAAHLKSLHARQCNVIQPYLSPVTNMGPPRRRARFLSHKDAMVGLDVTGAASLRKPIETKAGVLAARVRFTTPPIVVRNHGIASSRSATADSNMGLTKATSGPCRYTPISARTPCTGRISIAGPFNG